MNAIRRTLAITGRLAPPLAAEVSFRLWRVLGSPERVHERDQAVHERATVGQLLVGGERVASYTWGTGSEVILLVHGWRSRASRFSAVVQALESPDRTIVAFDAPGNGDSSGARVTILDYLDAITQLSRLHGSFEAIVGHSFGALAAFVAVREGVRTRRIIDIAGMYNADQLVDSFALQAGIRGRAKAGLRRRIGGRTFAGVDQPFRRFVAEIDPTHTHVPLLVIHDEDDTVVSIAQGDLIADAHTGPTTVLRTSGLGHARILGDPAVLAAISSFVELEPAPGHNGQTGQNGQTGHERALAG